MCFDVDDDDDDDDFIVVECEECPSGGWELCIELLLGLREVEGFGDTVWLSGDPPGEWSMSSASLSSSSPFLTPFSS